MNQYNWSIRGVVRATRQAILGQILRHLPPNQATLKVIIDLTTLPKCGKACSVGKDCVLSELESVEATAVKTDPWVRVLNGKRGLHLVMLYLVVGEWRVPWSFCIWQGKGTPSPAQLACTTLLARVPKLLTKCLTVVVLADTEFGTVEFLQADPLTAVASSGGNALQPSHGEWQDTQTTVSHRHKRGQQVRLVGMPQPLTVS